MNWLIAALAIVNAGGDTIELRKHPETGFYEIHYVNGIAQQSQNATHTLVLDDVRVSVKIRITGNGPERITVTVLDDVGLVAFPVEEDVPDGKDTVIQLLPPMF